MDWEGCGRKRLWLIFKLRSQNLLGGTEEDHRKCNVVSGSGFEL
jgi:hypothetical protein